MKPSPFAYHDPASLEEVLALLAAAGDDGRILAGGQSLVPLLNFRMARPSVLIDLNRCAALDYIRREGNEIAIGAMTRQWDAEHSDIVATHCPLLPAALVYMGHAAIRNRGTVGGSLAHADPSAELPAVAMAMNASIVLQSINGRRTLTPDEFFLDSLVTAIEPGEVLVEARFPVHEQSQRTAFVESGVRRADLAIAGIAAHVDVDASGTCITARFVALGGGTRPTLLPSVAAALVGRNEHDLSLQDAVDACNEDIDPPSDLQASSDYRRKLLTALTRRALEQLFPAGRHA